MDFIQEIRSKARGSKQKIVLPEGSDPRVLEAAAFLAGEELASIVLLGDEKNIQQKAREEGLNLDRVEIINPLTFPEIDDYAHTLWQMRKNKGMEEEEAQDLIEDPLYFSTMLVHRGYAAGSVAGACNSTGDVLRPAMQIIKTAPGISVVSGAFIMLIKSDFIPQGRIVFADCAVNPNPDSDQLAQIGVASAETARSIAGLEPGTAFLSFSTRGSASHQLVDKVVQATEKAREIDPDGLYDGELQADAAIVPAVASKKAPGSLLGGEASVLIFPDLQSGNIAYKLVERLTGAEAVGPILQGMARPINDLSRGCSVEDIINLTAITALQAVSE